MSKELEALKRIRREAGTPYFSSLYDIDMWREDFRTIEKNLKALEIIKNKHTDIHSLIISKTLGQYNNFYVGLSIQLLTQEEYDLLKEVLK